MNDHRFRRAAFYRILDADDQAPPPTDELDSLLRAWHQEHADIAAEDRARILANVQNDVRRGASNHDVDAPHVLRRIGRALTGRAARVAACIAIAGTIATALFTPSRKAAEAASIMNVAEGGELTAFAANGDRIGPCPLQHTDVDAEVTGPFTHVTLRQRYTNPYPQKIEAVYTFPMSHRSAVDQMRIIVRGPTGERVVDGEVKEREAARQIYESAKASGYVASLLEQERPNIFTQHVANIEPGSTIIVEIGYLETLERKDGTYSFDFPMTVAPRYVPGTPSSGGPNLPSGLEARAGLVLLGPAQIEVTTPGSTMTPQAVQQFLAVGRPIRMPTTEWSERNGASVGPMTEFKVTYANGSKETGTIYTGGSGHVNGRWFWYGTPTDGGTGFAEGTDQVPDAARITPMPVKPPERAGHDVSVRVTIDTGGVALRDVKSELHEVTTEQDAARTVITLKNKSAIPNRDFVLSWKTDSDLLAPGVYAHMRQTDDATKGGYFAVILDPPARVEEKNFPARELVFVLDTSGSMTGFPIEKAKEVMSKAIAAMRPQDTFNVITFAGNTQILWPEARIASEENKLTARRLVDGTHGGGGTEMMTAINAALKPLNRAGWMKPKELADLPADGRAVRVAAPMTALIESGNALDVGDGKTIPVALGLSIPSVPDRASKTLSLEGKWLTKNGDRVFAVDRASFEATSIAPTRIVMFLTDGEIGNDGAVIQAVRDNAKTTRVFSFGIGQSVNRYLLDGIAREGRGACDIVTLGADGDAAVARFVKRIQSPVLVDIEAKFDGIEVTDVIPDPSKIPDLFDEQPLMLFGRYAKPGTGTLRLSGVTGNGAWEQSMKVTMPDRGSERSAVPTLWARAKVESIIAPHRAEIERKQVDPVTHNAIVALGEGYQIMTPFTSFVAVEKTRITIGGNPVLVQVPIELPEGTSWSGYFGENIAPAKWLAMQPVSSNARSAGLEARALTLESLASTSANEPAAFFTAEVRYGTVDSDGGLYISEASTLSLAPPYPESLPTVRVVRANVNGMPDVHGDDASATGFSFDAATDFNLNQAMSEGGRVVPVSGEIPASDVFFSTNGGGFGGGGGSLPGKRAPATTPSPAAGKFKQAESGANDNFISGGTVPPTSTAAPATKPGALGGTIAPSGDGRKDPAYRRGEGDAKRLLRDSGEKKLDSTNKSVDEESNRRSLERAKSKEEKPTNNPPTPGVPPKPAPIPVPAPTGEPAPAAAEASQGDRLEKLKDASDLRKSGAADDARLGVTKEDQKPAPRVYSQSERDMLARRLDRALLALALAAEIDPKPALDLAKTLTPPLLLDDNNAVRVTILIGSEPNAMATMLGALREAGMDVDASDSATHLIVARVKLEALTKLALRDGIKRIEPLRPRPAPSQAAQPAAGNAGLGGK